MVVTGLKIFGRDRSLNGAGTFLEDLEDHHKFTLELHTNSGIGGYKLMPVVVPSMMWNVWPVPSRTYWIKDVLFGTSDWAAIMPRGRIKAKLNILDKGDQVGGVEIINDETLRTDKINSQ
ncbi:uncharacterized protein LOC108157998 [Drosophila miranda]|uniref:uncharacterized protein LOC108157998 n=1 Tax=Drosophila miranda TaxID=7229 RepID=UPI0007E843E1|nr:uncharacterized protein LOC108157998 [Drosophila miranda]